MRKMKTAADEQKIIDIQASQKEKQKKMQQKISYASASILVIVIVTFVAWPILNQGVNAGANVSFGSYRRQPISYTANYGLFTRNLSGLFNQLGVNNSSDDFQRRSVFERAFFLTVSQYGQYFHLLDQGNEISQKEANTLLYQQFNNEGKLDRKAWNELQNDPNRLKDAQNILTYAAAQNIWTNIYNSMDLVNEKELELLVPTLGDMRKVSYLYYKLSDYPEAKVEEFYNGNKQLFQKEFLRRLTVDSEANRKTVLKELESGSGNFGDLAQLYSSDVYSQSRGEYGYKYYYELLDTFLAAEGVGEGQATKWVDSVYKLKLGDFAGPFAMDEQWYFFQIKTGEEIAAEQDAQSAAIEDDSARKANNSAEENSAVQELGAEEPTGYVVVASVVRNYIEQNEISLITDYLRKNLESLKAKAQVDFQAGMLESLAYLDQGNRDVAASYAVTPKFFGFSYSSESNSVLYDPLDKSFPDADLAQSIRTSKIFFEDIFSLKKGELSTVMLFGTENLGNRTEQQYIAFFRLEDTRESYVNDFVRKPGDALDSKQTMFNYYMSNLMTSGINIGFLHNRNLKQRFDSAYSSWTSTLQQN